MKVSIGLLRNKSRGLHWMVTYSSFFDRGAFGAEDELLSGRGELGETLYGEVFVVEIGIFPEDVLCLNSESVSWIFLWFAGPVSAADLLHHRQYPRLSIVISVCANSQIDFLLKCVFSVSSHQPKQGIFWSLGHDILVEERLDGLVCYGSHGVIFDLI